MQSLFSTQRSVIPNICASVGQPITTEKLLVFFVSYVNYFTIHYQHRGKLNA